MALIPPSGQHPEDNFSSKFADKASSLSGVTPAPLEVALSETPPQRSSWLKLSKRARTVGQISALFVGLVSIGGVGGYFYSQTRPQSITKTPTVSTLSQDELGKLGQVGTDLGASGQVLNIGADALFRGKVDVTGGLAIGGQLIANGPVTLSTLNVSGATGGTGLNVATDAVVGGNAIMRNNLSVLGLTSLAGLNVSGVASVNSINAATIAVRNLSISGPLTIGHVVTQGTAPIIVANAIGGGGTTSISGNDTAGTVNLNTGAGPGNLLASITFRAGYSTGVHVLLTPLTPAAATSGYYVTRSAGGFQIHAQSPASGSTLSFDYLVVQ